MEITRIKCGQSVSRGRRFGTWTAIGRRFRVDKKRHALHVAYDSSMEFAATMCGGGRDFQ